MAMDSAERAVREMLSRADVVVGGSRPWDIQVRAPRAYRRVLAGGSLGLGESYLDGDWDCARLDEFFAKVLGARLDETVRPGPALALAWLKARLTDLFAARRGEPAVARHYDIPADVYMSFLDPYNQYTCAYFQEGDDLAAAQARKLDLICRKLRLKPGDRVLDIGCGWGGFAKYAAQRRGCRVTGVTISEEGARYAAADCRGLPVEIRRQDYREVEGVYDKILCAEMLEHVSPRDRPAFMDKARALLADDGLFVLQAVGVDDPREAADPWIERYIFPDSSSLVAAELAAAVAGRFVVEDWQNLGAHYDPTMTAWCANFERAWPRFKDRYDERFRRMWRYYFLSCAGSYRARRTQIWQVVLCRRGVPGGYAAPR